MTIHHIPQLILLAPQLSLFEKVWSMQQKQQLSIAGIWYGNQPCHGIEESIRHTIPILPEKPSELEQAIQRKSCDFLVLGEASEDMYPLIQKMRMEGITLLDSSSFWLLEHLIAKDWQLSQHHRINQELQTILTYAHEGIQLVNQEGTVQYVNPAFTTITGIQPAERIGKNIFEVSPDGSLSLALQTKQPVLNWKNKVLDSGVEVISNAAPIYVDGEMTGAVVTFQDMTQIMALSQQLQEQAQKIHQLHERLQHAHGAYYSFADIIGESEAVRQAVELAKKAADTNSTVLLTGESGTGKELFAHAIHQESRRSRAPFVAVNCAAIPETLLESELFGYEKGAFTGAVQAKIGKVEIASGGTLFLDEIGDMSPYLQAKLLRVLQSKQIERIGGLHPLDVDVRIIAATNRNLLQLIKEGTFREDLYYRLNIVRIEVPPLRHRLEDIPLLVDNLMQKISRRTGRTAWISNKAVALLAEHHWRGNVRELEGFLERIINENGAGRLADSLVLRHIHQISCTDAERSHDLSIDAVQEEAGEIPPLRIIERSIIEKALKRFGTTVEGKKRAARSLGISLATLYNKLREYQKKGGLDANS
ncbi:sigma-54 interaction domain-containing protein [Aneurinibacillus sp. REN35]|uniref:sigma-54 interaction domain-containing protein n=1 Tax=Aneurinibacillus sp. REN35 TaxID=3237286 RepID=UPI0035275DF7